jgi:hypothetical protein
VAPRHRYCYDVEIEVRFEGAPGERRMWHRPDSLLPEEPGARVLVVRGMVVDLAALTAEQACAADPLGNGFFPGAQELDAQHASLADLTRPGARPDLFICAEPPDWIGYRERTRASIPRLLWVIADGDQITQAHDA